MTTTKNQDQISHEEIALMDAESAEQDTLDEYRHLMDEVNYLDGKLLDCEPWEREDIAQRIDFMQLRAIELDAELDFIRSIIFKYRSAL